MSRRSDIRVVLQVADEQLHTIEEEYNRSLKNKTISSKLPVFIKNYLENLRAPLDYLASEICETKLSVSKNQKSYFPVSSKDQSSFEKFMDRHMPGLKKVDTNLYGLLESIQSYQPTGKQAISRLAGLVNENKHDKLSPQTRSEARSLDIEFPGGSSISMGPGSSISGGGIISSGDAWISPGGGEISSDDPVSVGRGFSQKVTVWVSFKFEDSGDLVLDLLRACMNDVKDVVRDVSIILWP